MNVFRAKFWVSLVLSIPIVLYAEVAQEIFNYRAPVFYGSEYLPFILASVIFFYGGSVFIASAYRELRAKMPGMMTLIALAISVACVYSVYVVFTGAGAFLGTRDAYCNYAFWSLDGDTGGFRRAERPERTVKTAS